MYDEIQIVLTELSDLVKSAEPKKALGTRRYFLHDLERIKEEMEVIILANS